jgi:hypothetical protein
MLGSTFQVRPLIFTNTANYNFTLRSGKRGKWEVEF